MKCKSAPSLQAQNGFTLIELMVTVSILGVLLAIAAPNLRDFVVSNRLSTNVNALIGALSYARSEAIVRNKQVIVCPKTVGASTCIGDDSWGKYETQIFVDEDGSDSWTNGDTLLKTIAAVDTSETQFIFTRDGGSGTRVAFQSGGFGNNTFKFDIYAKSSDSAYETRYGRTVCISRPGRARVIPLTNTTCSNF
jgi:type IV fimbrial biogenesis protein FimT